MKALLVIFFVQVISESIPKLIIPLVSEPPKNQSLNAVRIQLGDPKISSFNHSVDFQKVIDKIEPNEGGHFLLLKILTLNLPIHFEQCPTVYLNFYNRNNTSPSHSFLVGCLDENQSQELAIPDAVRLNLEMVNFVVDNPSNINSLDFILAPIWTFPCPSGTIICTNVTDLYIFESKHKLERFCMDIASECPVGVFYNGTDINAINGYSISAALFSPAIIFLFLLLTSLILSYIFCRKNKKMANLFSKKRPRNSAERVLVEADNKLEENDSLTSTLTRCSKEVAHL